ncbi:hypothetical protein [Acinetobacter guillouiae]|uniref:hypothetical protein n=1 Tax=Acinetobacter guillouiae TaxID=106649 RepID=UPI003AF9183E
MKELILNNLFGLLATIVVSFIVYFLQDRKARSADRERIKQTKKEIIDTIEAYIINNQNISESVIINFKNGIERANEVLIEKEWDSIALLQDISFRLQSSRHLAIDQKLTYANKLDKMISEWSSTKKLNLAYNDTDESELVNKILDLISDDKKIDANQYISDLLLSRRYHKERYILEKNERFENVFRVLTSLGIGLLITTILTFILKIISDKFTFDQSNIQLTFWTPSKIFYIIVVLFAVAMIFKFIRNFYLNRKYPYRRYKKKFKI